MIAISKNGLPVVAASTSVELGVWVFLAEDDLPAGSDVYCFEFDRRGPLVLCRIEDRRLLDGDVVSPAPVEDTWQYWARETDAELSDYWWSYESKGNV